MVILKEGGEVAQVGTPTDILARPADDFVRSFVGLDKGSRELRLQERAGRTVVLDAAGKAAGVLADGVVAEGAGPR